MYFSLWDSFTAVLDDLAQETNLGAEQQRSAVEDVHSHHRDHGQRQAHNLLQIPDHRQPPYRSREALNASSCLTKPQEHSFPPERGHHFPEIGSASRPTECEPNWVKEARSVHLKLLPGLSHSSRRILASPGIQCLETIPYTKLL